VIELEPNADKLFIVVRAGHAANNEVRVFVLFAGVAVGKVTDCNAVQPLNILDETPLLIVVSAGIVIDLRELQFWKIPEPDIPPVFEPHLPKNVIDCNDEHPLNIDPLVAPAIDAPKSGRVIDFNDEQLLNIVDQIVADVHVVGITTVCKLVQPEKAEAQVEILF